MMVPCQGLPDIVIPVDPDESIVGMRRSTAVQLIQAGPTVYIPTIAAWAPDLDLYIWSIDDDFGGTADTCMPAPSGDLSGLSMIYETSSNDNDITVAKTRIRPLVGGYHHLQRMPLQLRCGSIHYPRM